MDCVYLVYVQTYVAIASALRRDDAEGLRSTSLSIARLAGAEACAAAVAQFDALNWLPMRSKVHVCRVRQGLGCDRSCRDGARLPPGPGSRPGPRLGQDA